MKSKLEINYEMQGDYLISCFELNEQKDIHIGVWANRHKQYLKQHHKIIYYNLLTKNKLFDYLSDIEIQAENYYQSLVKLLAEKEKVDENLKANDMMLWVQKMNNMQSRAREIVNLEIIYNY